MKNKKVLWFFIGIFTIVVGLSGCGPKWKVYETDYFKYHVLDENFIEIFALTDLGAKQEILIVPAEINGVSVKGLNDSHKLFGTGANIGGGFRSDKLQKLFTFNKLATYSEFFWKSSNLSKVFAIIWSENDSYDYSQFRSDRGYVNSHIYNTNIDDPYSYYIPHISR